jgi:DNA-binding response OmpR family regulator
MMNPQKSPYKRILVADDETINLEFFEVMLSKLGFIVEKAHDGIEALEKIKRFNPDLIMVDNIMPRMSGWELTKSLKANEAYKDIPIIMFSAIDDIKDKVESFELGVEDYIAKPFNFSEVLARIRVVFRNQELLEHIRCHEQLLERLNADMEHIIAECVTSMDELESSLVKVSDSAASEAFIKVKQHIANLEEQIKKAVQEECKDEEDLDVLYKE